MIEQLYTDFTTKLLPKIAEGFTMTKEYFMDLFGRYAHFLFIQDVICAIVYLGITIGTVFFIKFCIKKKKEHEYSSWEVGIVIGILCGALMFFSTIASILDAIKDKYIPEVRVYEELKGFNK